MTFEKIINDKLKEIEEEYEEHCQDAGDIESGDLDAKDEYWGEMDKIKGQMRVLREIIEKESYEH